MSIGARSWFNGGGARAVAPDDGAPAQARIVVRRHTMRVGSWRVGVIGVRCPVVGAAMEVASTRRGNAAATVTSEAAATPRRSGGPMQWKKIRGRPVSTGASAIETKGSLGVAGEAASRQQCIWV